MSAILIMPMTRLISTSFILSGPTRRAPVRLSPGPDPRSIVSNGANASPQLNTAQSVNRPIVPTITIAKYLTSSGSCPRLSGPDTAEAPAQVTSANHIPKLPASATILVKCRTISVKGRGSNLGSTLRKTNVRPIPDKTTHATSSTGTIHRAASRMVGNTASASGSNACYGAHRICQRKVIQPKTTEIVRASRRSREDLQRTRNDQTECKHSEDPAPHNLQHGD